MSDQPTTIWPLMAKSLFGEATAAEKEALQELLRQDPHLQQQYDLLLQVLNNRPAIYLEKGSKTNQEVINHLIARGSAMEQRAEEPAPIIKKHFNKPLVWAAASLIFICLVGWWFFAHSPFQPKKLAAARAALIARNGARNKMRLPDGSTVWLNSGSKLFYITDFKGATREVRLEGEGFFDITKNEQKPFIVHANNIDIKVLGTAFNVKAYAEDENVETTLYRGLVNITKSDDSGFQPILLYPNQKLILPRKNLVEQTESKTVASISSSANAIAIKQIDSNKIENTRIETAWMYNRLEFRGDRFDELSKKMERWFDVKIAFDDEGVKNLSFTGSFEKESVEQALTALKTANSFNYKIKNNEILISASR